MFNVAGLMAEPMGTVREYEIPPTTIQLDDDIATAEPVEGRMRLTRTNRGLVVDARVTTALAGECARCLRPVVSPVKARVDEEVLPSIDLATGGPVQLEEGEDPEMARLNDHWELDMRPLLAAAISLQEPIAPLCEPDCPGLCPECGDPHGARATATARSRSTRDSRRCGRSGSTPTTRAGRLPARPHVLRRRVRAPASRRARPHTDRRAGRGPRGTSRSNETDMGVPKRKVAHARQMERRSHLALTLPTLVECPHCHEMKLPHRVCPACGWYNGRQAVDAQAGRRRLGGRGVRVTPS